MKNLSPKIFHLEDIDDFPRGGYIVLPPILKILQVLKLNFAKIDKLGVQIRSGDGGGNIFHKSISGGTFIKHQRQLTFEDQGSIEKE